MGVCVCIYRGVCLIVCLHLDDYRVLEQYILLAFYQKKSYMSRLRPNQTRCARVCVFVFEFLKFLKF